MAMMDEHMVDAELEQLLLEERSTSDQIATMKDSLDRLAGTVHDMVQKSALQVRMIHITLSDRVAVLRGLSTTAEEQITDSPSASGDPPHYEPAPPLLGEVAVMERELEHLEFVRSQLEEVASTLSTTLPDLVQRYSEQAQYDDSCMRELATLLGVSSTDVVDSVRRLLEWSESQTTPLMRPIQGKVPTSRAAGEVAIEQLNRHEFDQVEYHATFDPIAAAQGKLLGLPAGLELNKAFQRRKMREQQPTQRVDSPNAPRSRLKPQGERDPSSLNFPETSLARTFAAMALPEVEVFRHPRGSGFSDFVTKFRMKYEGLGLTDDMLVHLLLSKLEGYPRVVVDALPRAVREAGFAALIAALVEKFSENDSASQMKAYMALKTLSKRSDVSSYCVELEKLTQRAYPSASEADLSCTRAGELVAQLADWPEYLQLYTTMEVAPRECAYEWVKNLALRCERSRELARTAKATTEVLKPHTTPHRYDGLTNTRETQLNTNRGRTARLKQSKDATDTGQRLPRCYNCNEYGHFSRDCKKQRKADDKAVPASSRRNPEGPRVLTASWGRRIGDAGEILSPNYDLVGERTVRNVHLLGLTRKALLDTGSQISILPRQVIRAAELAGVVLDTDVETVPITGEHAVYDASGHRMKFGGAVRLAIQIEDGPKHRIPLFIMDGDDEMIVLGTNALKTLGFRLTKSDSNHESFLDPRKAENGAEGSSPATKGQNVTQSAASTKVVASERVYIRPGEQKVVTIKGPHRFGSGILWSEC
ncbi:unnamed protein product, partial [Nippostrongylus brasiliensis]|uniref:CCHC-type domain-containing protein n=1 Tax=Nippostrongylus brasiliensis TaxID=27835 RepID=A0A0N4Y395_NIPBR